MKSLFSQNACFFILFVICNSVYRCSHPDVFLGKGVLKICSKFTGDHPCRSVISIKLLCNFFEITLRHGCSPVTLLYIFRTPFYKNISGRLLLILLFHDSILEIGIEIFKTLSVLANSKEFLPADNI